MRQRLAVVLVAVLAADAVGVAQGRSAAGRGRITGSWEAYPLRGEGFGSGIPPKVAVAPPRPIPTS